MLYSSRHWLIALVLLALGLTPVAMAQQGATSTEFIEGHLDRQPKRWVVSLDRSLPTATVSTIAPDVHRVRINGYGSDRFSRAGSVLIEFTLRQNDGSWQAYGTEIRYFPFEPQHPRFSFGNDHGRGDIRIQSFGIEPEFGRINAEISATMFYHQSPNTRPISQRTQDIVLNLDLTLTRN